MESNTIMGSSDSTIIPIEDAIIDQDISNVNTHRPGVSYSLHTIAIPSDRRIIMIPKDVPVPPNSKIGAILFMPSTTNTERHINNSNTEQPFGSASTQMNGVFVQCNTRYPDLLGPTERERLISERLIHDRSKRTQPAHDNSNTNSQTDLADSDDMDATYDLENTPSDADFDPENDTNSDYIDNDTIMGARSLPVYTVVPDFFDANRSQTEDTSSIISESDITKPKKPRNSFFYFRREYHKLANANGGREKAKNISGAAGKTWKGMSEEEKAPYKKKAAEDTKRYKREMKMYKDAVKMVRKQAKMREKEAIASASSSSSIPTSMGILSLSPMVTDTNPTFQTIPMVQAIPIRPNERGQYGSDSGMGRMVGSTQPQPQPQLQPQPQPLLFPFDSFHGHNLKATTQPDWNSLSTWMAKTNEGSLPVQPQVSMPPHMFSAPGTTSIPTDNTVLSQSSQISPEPIIVESQMQHMTFQQNIIPDELSGIHPSIPDIEVISAENTQFHSYSLSK